jgi:hypothetical protein
MFLVDRQNKFMKQISAPAEVKFHHLSFSPTTYFYFANLVRKLSGLLKGSFSNALSLTKTENLDFKYMSKCLLLRLNKFKKQMHATTKQV